MPALSLPPQGAHLSSQQLAAFDAIKLFVARVQAFQPHFQLDANNAQVIAEICARMDGMPLAVELAASHVRRFTLQQLRDALHAAPLQMLAAPARDVEPRQRTLRGAIQWSYDLLKPPERVAFARLGVLAGVLGTMPPRTTAEVCRAAKLWGATAALIEKRGLINAPGARRRTDALVAEARRRVGPNTFTAAWAKGRELSLDETIELAME